ncbi:uncharacterized protein LOC131954322 [Physella acuta]|uniref:uncharacterized protein LOC131954322 n=1 Tax=Physella acuta TaxID=109671 RepID=UPI0027DE8C0D|nr:uncharacterized protein LOC131954322 [Physella acuta]
MTLLCGLTVLLMFTCTPSYADDEAVGSTGYSESFSNLLYVFNGYFTDRRQVEAYNNIDNPDLDKPFSASVLSRPVEITALEPAVTYLYEEYIKNQIRRRLICVIWQDDNGEIYLQPYNITSPPNDMSKPFTLDQIKQLTPSDLTTRTECKVKFQQKSARTFTAYWPDCAVENAPMYQLTWSCNSMVAISIDAKEVEYAPIPIMLTKESQGGPFPEYIEAEIRKDPCL